MTRTNLRASFGGETINLVLFAVMAIALALVIVAGAVFLIWNSEPIGNTASMVADVFAWIFAAAFSIAFLLSMIEQRRNAGSDANRNWSGDDAGHH